jgi:hypothetical protein
MVWVIGCFRFLEKGNVINLAFVTTQFTDR